MTTGVGNPPSDVARHQDETRVMEQQPAAAGGGSETTTTRKKGRVGKSTVGRPPRHETRVMEQQPADVGGIPSNENGLCGCFIWLCLLADCILTVMLPYFWRSTFMSEAIEIFIREMSGKECFAKIYQTTVMSEVLHGFANRRGVDRSTLIFRLEDGTEIGDDEISSEIGLKNQDRINVLSLRQWVQNELDARRQFHDHLQEQHDRLQEQLDRLQQQFMAASFKRDADDSNENENDAKRQRSE
jgi:hypothetical protein